MVAQRRRGGRRARIEARGPTNPQRPFAQPRLPWQPVSAISDDHVEAIHDVSLKILRDIGMDVLHPEARTLLGHEGAAVDPDSSRVLFDPEMVTEFVGYAPAEFTLHARNPAHDIRLGGNALAFAAVASPPNVSGLGGDRRSGTRQDFRRLVCLSQ